MESRTESQKRYMPGNGPFRVGDRIRRTERILRFTKPEIPAGTEGVIEYDYGFDYRYLVSLDTGEIIRSGWYGWEKV